MWRANMAELTRRLKLEACVQLVADKHGPRAAGAVAAMLQTPWGADGQSQPVPLGNVWRTAQQLARRSNSAGAAFDNERQLQSILRCNASQWHWVRNQQGLFPSSCSLARPVRSDRVLLDAIAPLVMQGEAVTFAADLLQT